MLYDFDAHKLIGINILEQNLFPSSNLKNELLELQQGIPFEKEIINIKTSEFGQISLFIKGSPIFKEETFEGGILLIEDFKVIERAKNVGSLGLSDYEKFLNSINDFLFVTDNEGIIKQAFGKKVKRINPVQNQFLKAILKKSFPKQKQVFSKKSLVLQLMKELLKHLILI